jgi:hypothetical protein
MAKIRFIGATFVFIAIACITTARADLMWGANGHPLVSYRGVTVEQQVDALADLGLRSYRVDVPDADAAEGLIKLLAHASARGIQILPVITPRFDLDNATPETLYGKAFDLAVNIVSQFKNQIRVWELGNEMENYAIIQPCEMRDDGTQYPCNWGPAGGVEPQDYFGPRWAKVSAVLKGLSDGTIFVDPGIRKAMGTAGWGHLGAFARMQKDGIRWDISVWHMYGEDPEWAFKFLSAFKRPIWVTEFNHPEGSIKGQQQQAEGLKKWISRLRELAPIYQVEAAHIYELFDEPYWAPSFEAFMGLRQLDKDGTKWRPGALKLAYRTVREMIGGSRLGTAEEQLRSAVTSWRACDLNALTQGDVTSASQVTYSYCLILGRLPDAGGLHAYTAEIASGVGPELIPMKLAASYEFSQKLEAVGLNAADAPRVLYFLLMHTTPDGGNLASEIAAAKAGKMNLADFGRAIVQSAEFRTRQPLLFAKAR